MIDHLHENERTLAAWLATNFRALPSVRRARVNANPQLSEPPPLLVVETWMQATLYVYTFTVAPSLRALRRTLTANTRAGVGSVFLLNRAALPAQRVCRPPPWLLALSILGRGRLFTYTQRTNGLSLSQLRLQPSGLPGEYELLWRDDIRLQRLAVSERVITGGPLRGHWLCAELDSENQSAGYAQAARARRTPLSLLDAATRESLSLLGLSAGATGPEIRRAFRRLARETHPDVSALPAAEAEARFRRLQNAYQHILHQRGAR